MEQYLDWGDSKSLSINLTDEGKLSSKFKIGFLRGLIDTDGYVNPEQREMVFNSISEDLLKDVSEILSELKINHKMYTTKDKRQNCRDMYRVKVLGFSAQKLIQEIEPRHPKKQLADNWSNK